MSENDGVARNASGGIEGYTNSDGHFAWGNSSVQAERARRASVAERLEARARSEAAAQTERSQSRGRER
jgi:hypothetical protein